jgi:hypothetical protein
VPESPRPADPPAIAATQSALPREAQAGQIWACTTNGVRTFSNNPCGEKSALLEIGPINTMNAAIPVHYARAYPAQPQYVPPSNDTSAQYDTDEDSDQEAYESGANSYTIVQGVAVLPRRRPHHHPHHPAYHPPYHHSPAPAPRKF